MMTEVVSSGSAIDRLLFLAAVLCRSRYDHAPDTCVADVGYNTRKPENPKIVVKYWHL